MYLGDQVIVTSNNGSITHCENNSNIKEILEVENKIEELENNKQLLNELENMVKKEKGKVKTLL